MGFELRARTEAGQAVASAAAALIPTLRERAEDADRSSAVCAENFQDLQTHKLAAAFVPKTLGGFGLESVHDWLVLINTLARGDASTAIAINMHLGFSRGLALAYAASALKGPVSDSISAPLKAIANGQMLVCATATERGTDNLHPLTTATQNAKGWSIEGHKQFVTLSPIATHLAMNLRVSDEDGDHLASTLLPIDAPGINPQDDWDALGMRGSGSQSIKFEQVAVAPHGVRKIGPWGQWSTGLLVSRTLGNLALVAAFLGIAEHAYEIALQTLQKQKRLGELVADSPGVQQMFGEMHIQLAQCQSILSTTGARTDEWLEQHAREAAPIESAHRLLQDYQAAKWTVNRGAIDIVNRAMDLVGGGGFMNSNPLTRLYRDVRAGPFMQPLGATEIRGYVGQVALGRYPDH